MKMSQSGLALIKRSEGLRLNAYVDPGTGGEPITIAYGHTGGIRMGDTCTEAQADAWLAQDIVWAEDLVNQLVQVPLTQGQFDALVSFAFNMGPGAKDVKDGFRTLRNGNPPTLRRKLDQQKYGEAADEIPKWANPPLAGIVIRRARERDLFLGRDWTQIPDGGPASSVQIALAHNAAPA
jgi:lysozyme